MHGKSRTRLYRVWQNIHKRCTCETDGNYKRYGGRGITICDEWKNSFLAFEEWAYKTGYDENAPSGSCTIDRIDNSLGYFPENCRWVGRSEQQNNRRVNHLLTVNGETHTISEWGRISGKTFGQIYNRLRKGWDAESAIFTPIDRRYSNGKTAGD